MPRQSRKSQSRPPSFRLTHLDSTGAARMIDVGSKPTTARRAVAEGYVTMAPATIRAIAAGRAPKGDVLAAARIAGILAAKNCGQLIPLCHPLPIESVTINLDLQRRPPRVRIEAAATITAKTGVEMEALAAVAVAALTVYDMCKAIDKNMRIEGIRLLSKTGGRSGKPDM